MRLAGGGAGSDKRSTAVAVTMMPAMRPLCPLWFPCPFEFRHLEQPAFNVERPRPPYSPGTGRHGPQTAGYCPARRDFPSNQTSQHPTAVKPLRPRTPVRLALAEHREISGCKTLCRILPGTMSRLCDVARLPAAAAIGERSLKTGCSYCPWQDLADRERANMTCLAGQSSAATGHGPPIASPRLSAPQRLRTGGP